MHYMMHWKRQHPCICVLVHFELFGGVPLSDPVYFSVYLYQLPSLKLFSLDGNIKFVWDFSLPGSCLGCAELLVCGPHHGAAVWMDRGSVKQSSNKATADKHLCVDEFGTGSLSQGGVKVKAEMGKREKKAERGWDELSHSKCSCGGLEEAKCEWQGPMN